MAMSHANNKNILPGGPSVRVLLPSKDGLKDMSTPAESPRLYVGNLAFDVVEKDLVDLFQTYGSIVKVRVARDKNKLSKG